MFSNLCDDMVFLSVVSLSSGLKFTLDYCENGFINEFERHGLYVCIESHYTTSES